MLTAKKRFPIGQIILFGFWPSPIKRLLYRLRGYEIGKNVSISFGAVVCGEKVRIGSGTSISFFSFVRGREIDIGERVAIGAATMIDTPYVEIGDDTRINEQVFIGGLQFPDSRIRVGKNCQIMQMTFINPAKGITIGDDTGIGGDSLVFGHTSWLSQFEGYPVQFEPIEIGNSVSIAWRVRGFRLNQCYKPEASLPAETPRAIRMDAQFRPGISNLAFNCKSTPFHTIPRLLQITYQHVDL